jgi:hypothetical protein
MQHVGDNMLAVTRELANADWVTGQNIDYAADKALEPSMFFDVLGRMCQDIHTTRACYRETLTL